MLSSAELARGALELLALGEDIEEQGKTSTAVELSAEQLVTIANVVGTLTQETQQIRDSVRAIGDAQSSAKRVASTLEQQLTSDRDRIDLLQEKLEASTTRSEFQVCMKRVEAIDMALKHEMP